MSRINKSCHESKSHVTHQYIMSHQMSHSEWVSIDWVHHHRVRVWFQMTCYLHIPWGEYVIEEYFMGEICCMKYVVCVCIFMCHRGNMWLRDMYMKYAGKTWVSWSRLGICQWDMTIRRDSLMWDITHSHEQRLIRTRHDAVFTDLTRDRGSRMTHDSDRPTCIEASLIRTCHDSLV